MNKRLDLFLTFAKIGAFTFGGGYAMISLLYEQCCEKKGWLTSEEMLDITAIAESTPGPIAINCATYAGYRTAGVTGALCATLGITLPSYLIIVLVAAALSPVLSYPLVVKAFAGIRVAVGLIIFQAGIKMARKLLQKKEKNRVSLIFCPIFLVILLTLNFLHVKFSTIYLIVIAGFAGFALCRVWKGAKKCS